MTYYFKTSGAISQEVEKLKKQGCHVESGSLICDCGESSGFKVYESYANPVLIQKLILCESCYENASRHEQGE